MWIFSAMWWAMATRDCFEQKHYAHFSYAIPLDRGTYSAGLYFAETYFGRTILEVAGWEAASSMFPVMAATY